VPDETRPVKRLTSPAAADELFLHEDQVPADPLVLFQQWYDAAAATELPEPGAMTLATATAAGVPDARIVLLRGFDERGFAFYTNYESRKAAELAENPRAALVFYWHPLARQVRIEGRVEKVTPAESDAYFRTRPLGHCLSAIASPQSRVIVGRADLQRRLQEVNERHAGQVEVPRPDSWGGYREQIEFWQGRVNRLHDRLRYRRQAAAWLLERLAP
jgi:pyridoxamine 5'-phosphate oxidase